MYNKDYEPNYSLGPDYYEEEPKKGFSFDITPYKKYLVPAIVLIIIVGAILFWLGSRQEVTFNIKCADIGTCTGATIEIIDSSGNKVDFKGTKGTLANGEYTVTVTKTNYAKTTQEIKVDKENTNFTITLYRNFSYTITLDNWANGEPIYGAQTIEPTIIITNTSPRQLNGTLTYSITSKDGITKDDVKVNFTPQDIDLAEGQAIQVKVSITGKKVTQEKNFEIKIFVKGGKEPANGVQMVLKPPAELEVQQSINITDLKANQSKDIDIKITNKSKLAEAKNVKLKIVGNTPADQEKLSWFSFTDPEDPQNPQSTIIQSIPIQASGSQNYVISRLTLKIPSTAKAEETFNGKIIYTSDSIDKNNYQTIISVKVKEGLSANIEFVGNKIYQAVFDKQLQSYEKPIDRVFGFRNNSNTNIDYLIAEIDYNASTIDANPIYSCQNWLIIDNPSQTNNFTILNFQKGATEYIPMRIIIPPEVENSKDVQCTIKWTYMNNDQSIFGTDKTTIRIITKK